MPHALPIAESPSWKIRHAEVSDAEAIHALAAGVQDLHAAALPHLFKAGGGVSVAEIAGRLADAPGAGHYWVATTSTTDVVEGAVIGHAYARLMDEPESLWRYAHRYVALDELSVAASARGVGVGAGLWAAVRAWAVEAGAARVVVNVWSFNEAARRFYVREGFTPFHERLSVELERSERSGSPTRSGAI